MPIGRLELVDFGVDCVDYHASTHTHAHTCEIHTCVDTHASADRESFSKRNFVDTRTLNFTLICKVRRLFIDYYRSVSGVGSCNSLCRYIVIYGRYSSSI